MSAKFDNLKVRSVKIPLNRQRPLKAKWSDIVSVNSSIVSNSPLNLPSDLGKAIRPPGEG